MSDSVTNLKAAVHRLLHKEMFLYLANLYLQQTPNTAKNPSLSLTKPI